MAAMAAAAITAAACAGRAEEAAMDGRGTETEAGDARAALVVNVDDLGVTPDATDAAILCIEEGLATTASMIVGAPDFERAAALVRQKGIPVGVHLYLTCEWAGFPVWGTVLPRERAPSLYDADGLLPRTETRAAIIAKPEEAAAEFRAQIERLRAAGIEPTHLDAHMGCWYQTPALLQAVKDLALEYRLPVTLPEDAYFGWMRDDLRAAGIAVLDGLDGYYDLPARFLVDGADTAAGREAAYADYLDWVGSRAPTARHLYIHVAPDTPESRRAYPDLAVRTGDLAAWTGSALRKAVADRGVDLVDYRGLEGTRAP